MAHYYIQVSGAAMLDLNEVARIADSKSGALMAIDTFDMSDISTGTVQLSSKMASEKRDYLFFIEAENRTTAAERASIILDIALTKRNTPVYNDFQHFLREYPQAPWRDQIQACLLHSNNEDVYGPAVELVIFVPGSVNVPIKEYYRGQASSCCLDLLEHFTTIPVQR